MKKHTQIIRTFALGLLLGTAAVSAQSCAATRSLTKASGHALNASGEVAASGAASAKGVLQAGSAVVAVPVWMSGAAVSGVGAVSRAIGDGSSKAGEAVAEGGDKLWDFASGDSAARPALDPQKALPAPQARTKPQDPSPAEAMKRL